jgi:hypothetical protein
MASELEPEVQAIDRSLLECSAEETAAVSAAPRGGARPEAADPAWVFRPQGASRAARRPGHLHIPSAPRTRAPH